MLDTREMEEMLIKLPKRVARQAAKDLGLDARSDRISIGSVEDEMEARTTAKGPLRKAKSNRDDGVPKLALTEQRVAVQKRSSLQQRAQLPVRWIAMLVERPAPAQ